MKLISMIDFVLGNDPHTKVYSKRCWNYANFLKQPLTLEMFVPCDHEGNVLEEPTGASSFTYDMETVYQKAKERVLFEGFQFYSMGGEKGEHFILKCGTVQMPSFKDGTLRFAGFNYKSIEKLISHNLELTPTALKQTKL